MRLTKMTFQKVSLIFFAVFLLFSCSKDADLLSEYVIADKNELASIALLVDDSFFISNGQPSILLDVLNNDTFDDGAQVNIIATSAPKNGSVIINTNNTLTYTPESSTPAPTETTLVEPIAEEDTFTYTTEVSTQDNSTFREEATVTISTAEMGELLAFPGAEGFGKHTTGGRGGEVIHVTNLNDSGPGSLRNAVERTGTRTVVFDVGGDIFLTGNQITISESRGNLTIAGETAPFPGITIRGDKISDSSYGGTLEVSGSNVIIRYISIRENNNNRTDNDAIRFRNDSGMSDIVLDHCSLSNGSDEIISLTGVTNSTFSNNMFTDSDTSYNYLFAEYNYNHSYIGNYASHTSERNVLIGYGKNGETSEWINNIIYGYEGGMYMVFGNHLDVLGNIYKSFKNNTPNYASIEWNPNQYNNPNGLITAGSLYIADNHQLNTHQYSLYNQRSIEKSSSERIIKNSKISTWATSVSNIEERVFGRKHPGNSLHQDAMDEQAINDYFSGTGDFDSLNVPTKITTSRQSDYDKDRDGMADAWEVAVYGNLSRSANGDENEDGYTNLEAFLFYLTQ